MYPIYAYEARRTADYKFDRKVFDHIMDKVWEEIAYRSEHGYYGGEYLFYAHEERYLPAVEEKLRGYGYSVYTVGTNYITMSWREK